MPIYTFIRGRDKQISVLLNQDNMTIITNVSWADPETGRYGVFVDEGGKLVLSPAGTPLVEERTGNIKILRVAQPGDYKILPREN